MLNKILGVSRRTFSFSVAANSKWNQDVSKMANVKDHGKEPSFLEQVNYHVDKAAEYTNLMPELLEFIKS